MDSGFFRALLGKKVSLRYRLHDDPAHPFSEAIGVVASVEGEGGAARVTLFNRRGEAVAVPLADIEAAKPVVSGGERAGPPHSA